jgi:alkanesulfonate monooxygenase SsuD/methylene tetrahydromethanopterin reductase-like flavin-dependent oxidoreductase (luciferase family)
MTHLAFELRTNTPDALTAELAEQAEARGYRSLWVNHPPDEDGQRHGAGTGPRPGGRRHRRVLAAVAAF